MGMTIEDCISKLIEILEEATEDENAVCYVTDVDEPTLKMAIDTIRKYQKIVGIVSLNDEEFKQCGLKELKEILEVIADGKTD